MADNSILIHKLQGIKVELSAVDREIAELMERKTALQTMLEEGTTVLLSEEVHG